METEKRCRVNAFGDVICPACGVNLIVRPGADRADETFGL